MVHSQVKMKRTEYLNEKLALFLGFILALLLYFKACFNLLYTIYKAKPHEDTLNQNK